MMGEWFSRMTGERDVRVHHSPSFMLPNIIKV